MGYQATAQQWYTAGLRFYAVFSQYPGKEMLFFEEQMPYSTNHETDPDE